MWGRGASSHNGPGTFSLLDTGAGAVTGEALPQEHTVSIQLKVPGPIGARDLSSITLGENWGSFPT